MGTELLYRRDTHRVTFGAAVLDEDLIRTKVSLIPEWVAEIRVVDIVGLDQQADGGNGSKRIRLEVLDGPAP